MVAMTTKVKLIRYCNYCGYEWREFVERETVQKMLLKRSIRVCPNPRCKKLTWLPNPPTPETHFQP